MAFLSIQEICTAVITFALIKPDRDTRWLKFDDDRVTPVTDKEVLEENYGGEALNGLPPTLQRNQVRAMKRFTNAYMLVYIRESAISEVLAPFAQEDTPGASEYVMIQIRRTFKLMAFHIIERRLEEERVQSELKKARTR